MINDVRRAYFYAAAVRDLYIHLPEEDELKSEGEVGKLNLSLYVTRDAACNWQDTLARHLGSIGFTRGRGHGCVFVNRQRSLWTMVHGDDFVTAGHDADLQWLRAELEKQYELKTQLLGPGDGYSVEGKVLNRVVRWSSQGWEVEADPRHARAIIRAPGIGDGPRWVFGKK